jgi:hypothetical protein
LCIVMLLHYEEKVANEAENRSMKMSGSHSG